MIRKSLFLLVLFAVSLSGCAQVEFISLEKLSIPGTGGYFHPKLDESGNLLLLTGENYKGLSLFNMKTGELNHITGADGAGYSPLISGNGETILFTANEFVQNRRNTRLMAYYLPTGLVDQVAPPSGEMTTLFRNGDEVFYKMDGQLKSARIGPDVPSSGGKSATGIEDQKLMLYIDGKGKDVGPYESESYIWPSVSPDKSRISAYAMGKGSFICTTGGKLIREFGKVEAPVWISDDFIAGMVTRDDGYRITASEIVLINVRTGDKKTISPSGIIAMYPTVSISGRKLVFQTADGGIYLMAYHITP